MGRAIGIDLGTTYSLAAVVENGRPRVLSRGDERLVPSVVGLAEDGRVIVGQAALNQYVHAPERTVRSIKRRMGKSEGVRLGDRDYLPEEISAFILAHMKGLAEESLGEGVDSAVITVPAYFDDVQRQATKRAGELAGFEVLRILNEPTAAALAYGLEHKHEQFLLVYDLGGGTFDVSVVEQQEDVLEVRSSHGNVNLGGDDFDERIRQYLLAHLSGEHRYDFSSDRRAMARLTRAAESAKIALSVAPFARVAEEFLARYDGRIAHLDMEIGRSEFEEMIGDLLASTMNSIERALADAKITADRLNRVLLVGGSTRIPLVSELIHTHLGIEPSIEINPDEAVALGAAAQTALIRGEELQAMLIDVSPHSLGIAVADIIFDQMVPGGFKPIIRRNTTIPATLAEVFYTVTPNQDTVEIEVYQGEHPVAAENTHLGSFRLSGIPPGLDPQRPREVVVEFSYNLNGIVEVTARDRRGERREQMTVRTTGGSKPKFEILKTATKRFDPVLTAEAERAVESAHKLELKLSAEGRPEDAARLHRMRVQLEEARAGDDEAVLEQRLNDLDDLLYDL